MTPSRQDRIAEIVVERLNIDLRPDQVDATASLVDDLGADSSGLLEVLTALEETFEIEVDDEEWNAETFRSVASLTSLVEAKLGAA